jgi:hypothetical protein
VSFSTSIFGLLRRVNDVWSFQDLRNLKNRVTGAMFKLGGRLDNRLAFMPNLSVLRGRRNDLVPRQ